MMINNLLQVLKSIGISQTEELETQLSIHPNLKKLLDGVCRLQSYWAEKKYLQIEEAKEYCINELILEKEAPDDLADSLIEAFSIREELLVAWNELALSYTDEQEILMDTHPRLKKLTQGIKILKQCQITYNLSSTAMHSFLNTILDDIAEPDSTAKAIYFLSAFLSEEEAQSSIQNIDVHPDKYEAIRALQVMYQYDMISIKYINALLMHPNIRGLANILEGSVRHKITQTLSPKFVETYLDLLLTHPNMIQSKERALLSSMHRMFTSTRYGATPDLVTMSSEFYGALKAYKYLDTFTQKHHLEPSTYLNKLAQHPDQKSVLGVFSELQEMGLSQDREYIDAVFLHSNTHMLLKNIQDLSTELHRSVGELLLAKSPSYLSSIGLLAHKEKDQHSVQNQDVYEKNGYLDTAPNSITR